MTREPALRRFRLIVFDLDGTLVDSRRDIASAANALLVECGALPFPEAHIGRMVGDGAATLVARAFDAAGVERPPDALQRFLAIYGARLTEHTKPYAGIPELLETLASSATLAVLTNKPLGSTREILDRLQLARHFDPAYVIGGDGPFPRKPDPRALRHLMHLGSAASDTTLLVGDSVVDWRTARAAPSAVCLARYGFGFEGFPVADLRHDEFLVDSPAGLLQL